ncbi:MAG: hypothetical protein AAF443_05975, partial [Chlamydiota bacterium]
VPPFLQGSSDNSNAKTPGSGPCVSSWDSVNVHGFEPVSKKSFKPYARTDYKKIGMKFINMLCSNFLVILFLRICGYRQGGTTMGLPH